MPEPSVANVPWVFAALLGLACSSGGDGGSGGNAQRGCSDLYADGTIPTFELTLSPNDWTGMQADCESKTKLYRPAVFKYGAETRDVMVRLKGNWSWRCDKMQFLISFNEVDSSGRFHGLRKIVLDAPWYDHTLLDERVAFSFVKRQGLPASCVNHARLLLNGAYYGLYANVERLDKEYLQRNFSGAEADGNLYDGGVELRTNEAIGDTSRRDALNAATTVQAIDALVDLDEAVHAWATEALLPDPDSYWAGVEINYFLYDHPTRGFLYLPYDMDMACRSDIADQLVSADPITYQNPDWLREPVYQTVLSDPAWCRRFQDELRAGLANYDTALMAAEVDRWAQAIAPDLEADPHKPFTNQEHQQGVATLRGFFARRKAFVENWLASEHCPVTRWPR